MPLFFPPKVFDAQSIFRLDIMAHGKEYGATHNKLQTIPLLHHFSLINEIPLLIHLITKKGALNYTNDEQSEIRYPQRKPQNSSLNSTLLPHISSPKNSIAQQHNTHHMFLLAQAHNHNTFHPSNVDEAAVVDIVVVVVVDDDDILHTHPP